MTETALLAGCAAGWGGMREAVGRCPDIVPVSGGVPGGIAPGRKGAGRWILAGHGAGADMPKGVASTGRRGIGYAPEAPSP
jgi:hypothetical protein